jgi:hypothetical protein
MNRGGSRRPDQTALLVDLEVRRARSLLPWSLLPWSLLARSLLPWSLLPWSLLAGCELVSLDVFVVRAARRLLSWRQLLGIVLASEAMALDVFVVLGL